MCVCVRVCECVCVCVRTRTLSTEAPLCGCCLSWCPFDSSPNHNLLDSHVSESCRCVQACAHVHARTGAHRRVGALLVLASLLLAGWSSIAVQPYSRDYPKRFLASHFLLTEPTADAAPGGTVCLGFLKEKETAQAETAAEGCLRSAHVPAESKHGDMARPC